MNQAGSSVDCLLMGPIGASSNYPYLGLCYLAGGIRRRGMSVDILDSTALGLTKIEQIIGHVKEKRPRIIGITITSMMLRKCFKMIQALQNEYPDGEIIVGGSHINSDSTIIVLMGVKYGMRGECEESLVIFCESILGGNRPENIPGLIINDGGQLIVEDPAFIPDLDTLPKPAYDLLPFGKYYSPNTTGLTMSMISSRGCPFRCIFCSRLNQANFRYQATNIVIEQLEYLLFEQNVKWIEFVDELFTMRRERAFDICKEIIHRGLDFRWGIQTRANMIDEELLVLMKKAGCRKISIGVESGSERIRYLDKKKVSDEDYFSFIQLCEKHKISTLAHYIFGHPTETEEDMLETFRFAKKLPSSWAIFGTMMPLPGSELFEQAVKSGELPSDIWTSYMLGKTTLPYYTPNGVDFKFVDKLNRSAYIRWYLSWRTIRRNILKLLNPAYFFRSFKRFYSIVRRKKLKSE